MSRLSIVGDKIGEVTPFNELFEGDFEPKTVFSIVHVVLVESIVLFSVSLQASFLVYLAFLVSFALLQQP